MYDVKVSATSHSNRFWDLVLLWFWPAEPTGWCCRVGLAQLKGSLTRMGCCGVQSAVNKAKGMVLNLSEIEIKVREATNDDAW